MNEHFIVYFILLNTNIVQCDHHVTEEQEEQKDMGVGKCFFRIDFFKVWHAFTIKTLYKISSR